MDVSRKAYNLIFSTFCINRFDVLRWGTNVLIFQYFVSFPMYACYCFS